MKVVIIGSTGATGKIIVDRLLKNSAVDEVISLSRRPLGTTSPKLTEKIYKELDSNVLSSLSLAGDIFISALGTTRKKAGSKENFKAVDQDLVVSFAKLAESGNTKALFVISAIGANPKSLFFYNKMKGEMEDRVSRCDISSIYLLRPSLLITERNESRPAETIGIKLYKLIAPLLPSKLASKMGTDPQKVAKFIEQNMRAATPGTHVVTRFN